MPGKSDLPAEFAPGSAISAPHLEQVYRHVRRHTQLAGSFASGFFELNRPVIPVGGSTLQRGEATTGIAAATSWTTQGTGTVQPKKPDGTDDGDPIEVANPFFDSFDIRSVIWFDKAYTPPQIVSVGCTVAPEA